MLLDEYFIENAWGTNRLVSHAGILREVEAHINSLKSKSGHLMFGQFVERKYFIFFKILPL